MGEREPVFSGRSFFFGVFLLFFFFNTNASARHLSPRSRKRKKFQNCWVGNSEDSKKNNNRKRKSGEAANECRRRRNKTQSKGIGICGRSLTKLIDVITRITPFPRNGNVGIAFHSRNVFFSFSGREFRYSSNGDTKGIVSMANMGSKKT